MANTLTGDFDAVMEVSARTLNRVLASVHQNAVANPQASHFPHVSYFRLDDPTLGIAGSVAAQIGVPQVELVHGSSDRVRLLVNVHARFRADPGSNPLADVIHGLVRAEYEFGPLDSRCYVTGDADDWLAFRFVDASASFEGVLRTTPASAPGRS